MAKKEAPQIEERPKTQNQLENYQKLYTDISGEIVRLTSDLKYDIQWLERHCQKTIEKCESEWDIRSLMELRDRLEKTRNDLRIQSYSLLYGSDYTKFVYGEISEEEFMRTLEY